MTLPYGYKRGLVCDRQTGLQVWPCGNGRDEACVRTTGRRKNVLSESDAVSFDEIDDKDALHVNTLTSEAWRAGVPPDLRKQARLEAVLIARIDCTAEPRAENPPEHCAKEAHSCSGSEG